MPDSPLLHAFAQQARWCRDSGAPFTATVLARSQRWLARDALGHAALAAVSSDPLAAAVALRWAGALHHLALRGEPPWAGLWPPAKAADSAGLEPAIDAAISAAWRHRQPHLQQALARAPQTNEVQRSAILLPGLLHVAARTGLPLALLEIGASAGLNLWCERWHHETTGWHWGEPSLPVLCSTWVGPAPAPAPLRVVRREGCDLHPVDLQQADEGLRLASFVWPDQPERLARLKQAMHAAAAWMRAERVAVQACSAAAFVAAALAPPPRAGQATVLMHSIMWQYMPAAEQQALVALIEAAGRRASAAAPLAWLRFEPPAPDQSPELRCRLWPGGEDRLLARAHAHVGRIEWLAGASA